MGGGGNQKRPRGGDADWDSMQWRRMVSCHIGVRVGTDTPEVGDPRSSLTSHLSHEISDVDRKGCARPLGFCRFCASIGFKSD